MWKWRCDLIVAVFSEVQNLTASVTIFPCGVSPVSVALLQMMVDSQSCLIHVWNIWTLQAPLAQVFRDFDTVWSLPSEHVLIVCQWCRCAVCLDAMALNGSCLCWRQPESCPPGHLSCHVSGCSYHYVKLMFFLSVFILPHTFFCEYVLLHSLYRGWSISITY